MCGLSAVFAGLPRDDLASLLGAMHARIGHRGPDGEGFAMVDAADRVTRAAPTVAGGGPWRAGLAFRWLHILDPASAAGQPMASRDGRVLLMLNGEIYNYRELRDQLAALGHTFHTHSDTEVVLAAYMQWGVAMFDRLNGMWAMVLVDLRDATVLVSRDRFGIKPLFYARHQGCLLFGSEVKQLLAGGAPAAANAAAVADFYEGARPDCPEQTFFAGVLAVPAASYARFELQAPPAGLTFMPYWAMPTFEAGAAAPGTWTDVLDALEEVIADSVLDHMTGPAPIAILISGGLDSSLVAALAAPAYMTRKERGTAISMVLSTSGGRLDERVHAEEVTAMLGYQGHSAAFTPEWLKSNIGRVTEAQEEPVAGMAVAGQFVTYGLAAALGCRVVLDGQGADELFGGYPRHQMAYLRDCLRRIEPQPAMDMLASLALHEPRYLARTGADWFRRRIGLPARARAAFLLPRDTTHDAGSIGVAGRGAAARSGPPHAGAFDAALRHDVATGNLRAVLAVTDRNAMAHSIEARVPFVDRRVAEFAFALPARFKLANGQRKRILRLLGERHLPAGISNRTDRIGFGAPTLGWLRTHFRTELNELPDGRAFTDSVLVDRGQLRSHVAGFLAGRHDDAGTLWRLYAVEQWARCHAVTGL